MRESRLSKKTRSLYNYFAMRIRHSIVPCLILAATVVVWTPALTAELLNWDDPAYITKNHLVKDSSGIPLAEIFSTYVNGNFHPLTILTFALEYRIAGETPFIYHATNLLLHLLNVWLVFLWVKVLTRKENAALVAAVLFALHPTRVESVVWVTERKDVLFGAFYLAGLILWTQYARRMSSLSKTLTAGSVCLLLSGLSKPAAVSFPLSCLWIDLFLRRPLSLKLFIEKIPFFLIAFLFGLLALLGSYAPPVDVYPLGDVLRRYLQGATFPFHDPYSLTEHLVLSAYAVSHYLFKLLPVLPMSPYYPYPEPGHFPPTYFLLPALAATVCAVIWRISPRKDLLVFGAGFFFTAIMFNLPFKWMGHGSLLGDRFTYIPYLGLFVIIAISAEPLLKGRYLWILVFVAALSGTQTFRYNLVWQNNERLWTHTIQQYPDTALPWYNRGNAFLRKKDYPRAIADYTRSIARDPKKYEAYMNRGNAYSYTGRLAEALEDYSRAVELKPRNVEGYLNRALTHLDLGNTDRALADCDAALKIDPDHRRTRILRNRLLKPLADSETSKD